MSKHTHTQTENVQRCLLSVFVDATLIRSWCASVVDASKKLVYICCFVELFCLVEREIQTIDQNCVHDRISCTSNEQCKLYSECNRPLVIPLAGRPHCVHRKSVDACSVSQSEIAIRGDRKWDNLYFTFSVSKYFSFTQCPRCSNAMKSFSLIKRKTPNSLLGETGKIVLTHSIVAECKS